MNKIVSLSKVVNLECEASAEEVNLLVDQYLKALVSLREIEDSCEAFTLLANVKKYTHRLEILLSNLKDSHGNINFQEAVTNAYQNELRILEGTFLKIKKDLKLGQFDAKRRSQLLHLSIALLQRMQQLLDKMGFCETHEDVQFVYRLIGDLERKF
jgi:hypothetical protein